MAEIYQNKRNASAVGDTLEEMVREGARSMLAVAIEEEMNAFLGREGYE